MPRHPQRFDEVATLIEASGLSMRRRGMRRRGSWADAPLPDASAADALHGDSLGEMALYYAAAHVALLGGSFAPLGGQNLIEAAACGCPVVMGPSTFNFAQAAELAVRADAAIRVADVAEAVARGVALCAAADACAWSERERIRGEPARRGAAHGERRRRFAFAPRAFRLKA